MTDDQTVLYQSRHISIVWDRSVDVLKYEFTPPEKDDFVRCNGLMFTYKRYCQIMKETSAASITPTEWNIMKQCIDEHLGVVLITRDARYDILLHHVRSPHLTFCMPSPPYRPEDEIASLTQTISNFIALKDYQRAGNYSYALGNFYVKLSNQCGNQEQAEVYASKALDAYDNTVASYDATQNDLEGLSAQVLWQAADEAALRGNCTDAVNFFRRAQEKSKVVINRCFSSSILCYIAQNDPNAVHSLQRQWESNNPNDTIEQSPEYRLVQGILSALEQANSALFREAVGRYGGEVGFSKWDVQMLSQIQDSNKWMI